MWGGPRGPPGMPNGGSGLRCPLPTPPSQHPCPTALTLLKGRPRPRMKGKGARLQACLGQGPRTLGPTREVALLPLLGPGDPAGASWASPKGWMWRVPSWPEAPQPSQRWGACRALTMRGQAGCCRTPPTLVALMSRTGRACESEGWPAAPRHPALRDSRGPLCWPRQPGGDVDVAKCSQRQS